MWVGHFLPSLQLDEGVSCLDLIPIYNPAESKHLFFYPRNNQRIFYCESNDKISITASILEKEMVDGYSQNFYDKKMGHDTII